MITTKIIDSQHKVDINILNEPFKLFGQILVSYNNGKWDYQLKKYSSEKVTEMCFPDKNYDYDAMKESTFIGAYDGKNCIGLAILQLGFFKYMYLSDLKVNKKYRGQHVGQKLIAKAKEIAKENDYAGLYTQGQDNNPGACLFYLHTGFYVGGLDTNVYRHTKQEGKADIIFFCEVD